MATRHGARSNELALVNGIGEKVAARLAERGINTLSQLARTPAAELASLLDGVHGGFTSTKIEAQRWREQADELVRHAADTTTDSRSTNEAIQDRRPPDVRHTSGASAGRTFSGPALTTTRHNFTVEATIDARVRAVIACQAEHVQTGDQMRWRRWDREELLAFMEERMGVTASGDAAPAPSSTPPTEQTLHAYAMVPAAGVRVGKRDALSVRVSFDGEGLDLDRPDERANARVNVFTRPRAAVKAQLVGSSYAAVERPGRTSVTVPCRIPPEATDGVLFAVVEVHTARACALPRPSVPGAALVLVE